MIVYHGSTKIIKNPQIGFSKKYLDFGEGFYVTTFQDQAEKWAKRKTLRYGGKAFVNVYEMGDLTESFNILNFDSADEKWLDFVCGCRRGESLNQDYDIIYGNVADDDVFKTVDMYFRGLWDKEKTLNELRYYRQNNQFCFVTQVAIDSLLVTSKNSIFKNLVATLRAGSSFKVANTTSIRHFSFLPSLGLTQIFLTKAIFRGALLKFSRNYEVNVD